MSKRPPLDTRRIRQFRRVLRRFERIGDAHLRDCCAGVTLAQCHVLLELDEHGRSTVGQLAARLRLDDSTLSRTIDGLVRKGRLVRSRDERDRRVAWIELAPAGRGACQAIHAQNDALYRDVFARLRPGDREAVLRHFEMLVQAFLDDEDAKCGAEVRRARRSAGKKTGVARPGVDRERRARKPGVRAG